MSSGKMSPRQKMINMMYLVLIALLALNVSKEIIKAFNLMENSLDSSTKSIVKKNEAVEKSMRGLADKNAAAAAAVKVYGEAKSVSTALIDKIELIKKELLAVTEGRKPSPDGELVKGGLNELMQGDNMEVHANYFVVEKGGQRGTELQKLINDTRTKLLAVLDKAANNPDLSKSQATKEFLIQKKKDIGSKTSLVANDGTNTDGSPESWVAMYLEHSPLAGVFALLSKIENDARGLEAEIAQALAESVSAADLKFDMVIPVISAATGAVLTGQTYEADILLAAYSSKSQMKVTINGSPIEVKDGKGLYKVTPQNPGEFDYEVGISVPQPDGSTKVETAKGKYSAFAPMAAISADELNVFYVGLPNPVSISVAGFDASKIQVSISTPDVQLVNMGKGHYEARVPVRKGNDATISVMAKVKDRYVPMGGKKFKIRNVPRPVFKAGTLGFDKPLPLSALQIQSRAAAVLENFIYDGVKYTITGYTFIGIGRTGPKKVTSTSASLDPIKGILGGLRPGEFIMFTDIRAVGPGGAVYLDNASGTLQ